VHGCISKFASILLLNIMNPMNFLYAAPNAHVAGLNFISYFPQDAKCFLHVRQVMLCLDAFNKHVINVDFYIFFTDLVFEQ
jgi:hypothetical protein